MKRSSRPALRLAWALAATGVLGAALAATGAVGAAFVSKQAPAKPQISARASGPLAPAAASSYLAGYQITEPGISRASVSFVVPTMSCPTSDTQGTGEGIGNEQIVGNPTLLAIVLDACLGGAPFQQMEAQA